MPYRPMIPILMYHAIDPKPSLISLDPTIFAMQMSWLYENGYTPISQGNLAKSFFQNEPLPEKSIVLTFDDGYQSVYDHAFAVLKKYGFTATIFLVSGYCGKQNNWPGQPAEVPRWPLLNWQQIKEMDGSGIEFGAHGVNHAQLDLLESQAMQDEILNSKLMIQDQLGHEIFDFAYPYGKYNPKVKKFVSEVFASACTTKVGLSTIASDPYELERIEITYLKPPWLFHGLDRNWFPGYLKSRKVIRKVGGKFLRRNWD